MRSSAKHLAYMEAPRQKNSARIPATALTISGELARRVRNSKAGPAEGLLVARDLSALEDMHVSQRAVAMPGLNLT